MPDLPINDASILGASEDRGGIELGVVGWPGDADHADVSAQDLNGRTLVKVTLLRGGTPFDTDVPDGEARGTRIRCRVKGPDYYVPPKGTEVMVAIPAGFGLTDGAPVIIACMGPTPDIQYSKTRAKIDYGPNIDLVIKARSVSLVSYNAINPDDAEDFIAVGPDSGIHLGAKEGHGLVLKDDELSMFITDADDAKTVVRLGKTMIELVSKDSSNALTKLEMGNKTFSFASEKFFAFANQGILGITLTPPGIPLPFAVGPTPGVVSTGWMTCCHP